MKLTLGFSPCPNDTFIFDGIVNKKVATGKFDFEPVIEDVEVLNKMASQRKLDITKLSYAAYAGLEDDYDLLSSGSALGSGCGPLLVGRQAVNNLQTAINKLCIAIPGLGTTANFLLSFAFPGKLNIKEMMFSKIEDAVVLKEADAGLIIHENRFTFRQKGLVQLIDLGEYWELKTGLPIPLGGIVIRKSLDIKTKIEVNNLIRESVNLALAHPGQTLPFVRTFAQSMEDTVMQQHIALYVNHFTQNLGKKGTQAVELLLKTIKGENNNRPLQIIGL